MIAQLPLSIQLRDDATLTSFFPGENQEVLQAITKWSNEKGEPFLYLWGHSGAGRSHLLQATCHAAIELGIRAVYMPLRQCRELHPTVLQGLEELTLICVDDVHLIAGNLDWEEALFHLFNRVRSENKRLLISANVPPNSLKITLADLKSRLNWGVVYQLQELTDEQKLGALQLRAKCRGLQLHDTVGQFLLSRWSRHMSELFQVLEVLDKASLAEQRRLTIPFVKQVLEI